MKLDLSGKNAIVCGSSKGIGKAIAFEFARLGCSVTMIARDKQLLEENLVGMHTGENQSHSYMTMDFDKTDELRSRLKSLEKKTYHILVNNTGGPPGGPLIDAAEDEIYTAFRRHLIANHVITEAVVPGMRESKFGRIINIISTSVKQPIPGLGVSNTIRGAVANWAKTLAGELGPYGITVNNILPGFTETDRLSSIIENKSAKSGETEADVSNKMILSVPLRRFAKPEETAYAAAFLASDLASYISGINLPVDGGRTSSL
ncbi:MAG: SDR family oxidoreductase [Chitinophagales bacterium]|nr:SDR family oxidoreductase [Chitinophagales bacterium]